MQYLINDHTPLLERSRTPDRSINRYYDPTTDQFISVDPAVVQTNQAFAFVNDNPLNATDPLGLKGWYCIGGVSHYYAGNKYGKVGGGKCKVTVKQVVNDAVTAIANSQVNVNIVQACGNLAVVQLCFTGTSSSGSYWSLGTGIGMPGVTVNAGQTRGLPAQKAMTGWSTCIDAEIIVGGGHCWNTPGSGSSNYGQVSPWPGAGVFVNYGWRMR